MKKNYQRPLVRVRALVVDAVPGRRNHRAGGEEVHPRVPGRRPRRDQGTDIVVFLIFINIEQDIVQAYKVEYVDVASKQEVIGSLIGGWLPYIFILFGFWVQCILL